MLRGLKRYLSREEPERFGRRSRASATRPREEGQGVGDPVGASYPTAAEDAGNTIPEGITFEFPDTVAGKMMRKRMTFLCTCFCWGS